MAHVTYKI